MTIWNSVPNSGINFSLTKPSSEADIFIIGGRGNVLFTNNELANAFLPNDGEAGRLVLVNLDNSLRYDERFDTMVHELGHTIGFRHTGGIGHNEYDVNNADVIAIPGTSTGDFPDPNSVMNTFADGLFSGLSYYDKVAVAFMYPN